MLLQGNCLSNVWTIKVTFEALLLAAAVPVQTGAGIRSTRAGDIHFSVHVQKLRT